MDYPKCPNCQTTTKGRPIFQCPKCSKYFCDYCGSRSQCPKCKQKGQIMEVGKIVPRP